MKIKSLIAASLALTLVGTASAIEIRMTGSTAFRKQTLSAIINLMGGSITGIDEGTLVAPATMAYTGAANKNLTANAGIYKGTIAGESVTILTSWSGSNAGIQVTAGSFTTVQFIPIEVVPADDGPTPTTGLGTPSVPDPRTSLVGSEFDTGIPDVAMMDTFQASTPFLGTFSGTSYATLTATRVGIIPYKWIASEGTPSTLDNMTPLQAQAQWTGVGQLPLSFYTGLVADAATIVYATGRNAGSGTRNAAFTESGVGALSVVQQYRPETAGPSLYPATTINGISYGVGNNGEDSGGTLADKMAASPVKFFVTYLGLNDADTKAIAGGAHEMSWNGVFYSTANVIEGKYTFWTYQHLGYRSSTVGAVKTVADAIAAQIILESSVILLDDMHVERFEDGGPVSPL